MQVELVLRVGVEGRKLIGHWAADYIKCMFMVVIVECDYSTFIKYISTPKS
jgi:hypothetical protein